MCGIIGAISHNSKQLVANNLKLLSRRGPDSQGTLTFQNGLTLGAARLAMTDPHPRSNQPMVDNSSDNVIVFNGEIYNFKSIRKRLIEKGAKFSTESDTEVLLKALDSYGIEFLPELEGMFAFAYYNKTLNKLYLARDFLGKKPLYFYLNNNVLFFASQINVLKKSIDKTSINYKSLSMYLKLGYLVNNNTMFSEIQSLEPGSFLSIDLNLVCIESQKTFIPSSIINPPEQSISESINSAILERVDGHESFALSLSGGIDSSLIAIQSVKLGLNFDSYSMRWTESDKIRYNQDHDAAARISKKLGIKFHTVDMPGVKNIPELLTEYVRATEDPNSSPTGLSMMVLYKYISNHGHRLVLTGDGADEVFGGYDRYKYINKISRFPQIDSDLSYKLLSSNKFTSKFSLFATKYHKTNFWLYWQQLAKDSQLQKILGCEKLLFPIVLNSVPAQIAGNKNWVQNIMARDLLTWLSMESNQKLDRISMRFSIEARSPFQSETVIGCGLKEMNKLGFQKMEKQVLTGAFPDLKNFPINNKKMGFISPLGFWLRNNPDLINESMNHLITSLNFDKKELTLLAKSPLNKDYKQFRLLWSLIVLSRWHNLNFN